MSEKAGDSRFLLFCKDDPTRPTECRWCGVVVEQNGEVQDAILQPTEEALLLWFDGWQSGRKSAEFDNARKDERPMTVDEIIASVQANPDCLIASGVRVLVDEVLRLRSEAINADLLAALKLLLACPDIHDVGNEDLDPETQHAERVARAAIRPRRAAGDQPGEGRAMTEAPDPASGWWSALAPEARRFWFQQVTGLAMETIAQRAFERAMGKDSADIGIPITEQIQEVETVTDG